MAITENKMKPCFITDSELRLRLCSHASAAKLFADLCNGIYETNNSNNNRRRIPSKDTDSLLVKQESHGHH